MSDLSRIGWLSWLARFSILSWWGPRNSGIGPLIGHDDDLARTLTAAGATRLPVTPRPPTLHAMAVDTLEGGHIALKALAGTDVRQLEDGVLMLFTGTGKIRFEKPSRTPVLLEYGEFRRQIWTPLRTAEHAVGGKLVCSAQDAFRSTIILIVEPERAATARRALAALIEYVTSGLRKSPMPGLMCF